MKKLIIIAVLMFGMTTTAQTVNGFTFEEIDQEFVQIVGTAKLMSNRVNITINFGQENKVWNSKDDGIILDASGKKKKFNTMIDALNFMHSMGYDYVDAYAITLGNQNVYHYLLRRKKQ